MYMLRFLHVRFGKETVKFSKVLFRELKPPPHPLTGPETFDPNARSQFGDFVRRHISVRSFRAWKVRSVFSRRGEKTWVPFTRVFPYSLVHSDNRRVRPKYA